MADIIIPRFGGKRCTATLNIVEREGGRFEIVCDFDPPCPDARSFRRNPAASLMADILFAAKSKGVVDFVKLNRGGGVGADITQARAAEAGHFDRETEEG